jgi:hypothetical protein
MANGNEQLHIVANDTGCSPSPMEDDSWNSLFL